MIETDNISSRFSLLMLDQVFAKDLWAMFIDDGFLLSQN